MGFFRRLLGLDQEILEPRDYADPKFKFTIRIPKGWRQNALIPQFRVSGGCLALSNLSGGAINISCGAPDDKTPIDKIARVEYIQKFLVNSIPNVLTPPLRDVATPISGEANTARAEVSTANGFNGLISIIHRGLEYTIQYQGTEYTRSQIEMIISSFGLPNTSTYIKTNITDCSKLIGQLDATAESERKEAYDLLIQEGENAIPSIVSSVNACNQSIMTAGTIGPQRMEIGIRALRTRIELLGAIGDKRGIPSILNAIGDSAKSQELSLEASKLLRVSQDALIKIGQPALEEISKVIETPSAEIRLALTQILAKIKGEKSQQVLQRMLDDPVENIRNVAQNALKTFEFKINRRELGTE